MGDVSKGISYHKKIKLLPETWKGCCACYAYVGHISKSAHCSFNIPFNVYFLPRKLTKLCSG